MTLTETGRLVGRGGERARPDARLLLTARAYAGAARSETTVAAPVGAGFVGATNAARKSLVRSLTTELDGSGPRVHELVTGPLRTRPRAAIGADHPGWFSAEALGRHAALIAGDGPYVEAPLRYLITRAQGVRTSPPQ
ncbi:hypothetical protein ACFYZJ_27880 [Streptomyces sp. NPDC001848]|uniref:hypothetical protein n=1 Tax=Streptomyces sp. NPDC001848 TaxID=3364618 RepID=UPI0036D0B242